MPSMPKKITVDQRAMKLFIDGEEFPWYISTDGVTVSGLGSVHEIPVVTFAIMADTVEVIPASDAS